MIVHKDYVTFMIKGKEMNIIHDIVNGTSNCVVEMDDKFHYLGNEDPNIFAAILAFEKYNNVTLTVSELQEILQENKPNIKWI